MKSRKMIAKRPVAMIGSAYVLLVGIRFVLALLTSAYPMNNIDEFLYYSMARSIAAGDGLLFRGQSADYVYILFSLVLSPVYMLFENTVHIYRILQFWNTMLMNLTIFPLYELNRRIVGEENKAVGLTLFLMLFPDFILGEMILSEAILYPLFFTMLALVYSYLSGRNVLKMLGIGILGGVAVRN